MKLSTDPRLPQTDDVRALKQRMYEVHRDIAVQVNAQAEGRLSGSVSMPSAPTSGSYAVGDFVRNSAPSELGSAGSMYVITGWLCVGQPLIFVPTRSLTGN